MRRRVFGKWIEKREKEAEVKDGGDFIPTSEFLAYLFQHGHGVSSHEAAQQLTVFTQLSVNFKQRTVSC